MADDGYRKPFRSDDSFGRTTGASRSSASFSPAPMAPAESPSGASDPLAELARLIGQSDPFAEFGRAERAPERHIEQRAEPAAPTRRAFSPFERSEPTQPGYVTGGEQPQYDTRQYGLPFGAQANAPVDYGHHASAQMPAPMTTHAAGMPGGGFHDAPGYDPAAFADQSRAGQETYYDDVPPPRRRIGVLALAGVFALAVIGTAGALGYRALFGSSAGATPPPVIKADATPSKVVPPAANGQANKLINDRIGDKGQGEKLVSREEQPVDIARQMMTSGAGSASPAAAEGGALYEPKKVKTIAIRPDQPGAGSAAEAAASARTAAAVQSSQPAPARPSNAPMPLAAQDDERAPTASAPRRVATSHAPLSLAPGAGAAPTAAAPAPRSAPVPAQAANGNGGGGYAVQISSQRSEADAQTAFRNMQGRFPGQLGGRQAMIRRADLGSKGVYYRALVGPFGSANEANELCNSLKVAGGQCIVQRI